VYIAVFERQQLLLPVVLVAQLSVPATYTSLFASIAASKTGNYKKNKVRRDIQRIRQHNASNEY